MPLERFALVLQRISIVSWMKCALLSEGEKHCDKVSDVWKDSEYRISNYVSKCNSEHTRRDSCIYEIDKTEFGFASNLYWNSHFPHSVIFPIQ
jgi:hypothetical protein